MRQRPVRLALLVLGLAACSAGHSSAVTTAPGVSAAPESAVSAATATTVAVPQGFEAVTIRVTDAQGVVHESCVLVADNDAKREHGLMDVDSLGGYDGMLFRFTTPSTARFYMFQTRIPLSVAFFGSDDQFVSAADMPPCTASHSDQCPLYGASAPYVAALEVPQGGLGGVGVGPGSRVAVGSRCTASP